MFKDRGTIEPCLCGDPACGRCGNPQMDIEDEIELLETQLASVTEERDLLRKALVVKCQEEGCDSTLEDKCPKRWVCGSTECIDLHIAKAKEG